MVKEKSVGVVHYVSASSVEWEMETVCALKTRRKGKGEGKGRKFAG